MAELYDASGEEAEQIQERAMTLTTTPTRELVARVINEVANKEFNLYRLGKHEAFVIADAVLAVIGARLEATEAALKVGDAALLFWDTGEGAIPQHVLDAHAAARSRAQKENEGGN